MVDDDDYDDLDATKLGVEKYAPAAKNERDRPYLIVLSGPNVGEMFAIEGSECFVGRGEQAGIRFRDDNISRKHLRIRTDGADVHIEDLGSANGTFVNGERITIAPLRDGDKIRLGATTVLKFSYHDKLEADFQRQMRDAALRDALTKALNKKALLERLSTELAFAHRHEAALGFLMIDVDHFKAVNDTHGHLAGDHVLAKLSATVQSILRAEDVFGRYGGEELAVLCRSTTLEGARVLAERIRKKVESTVFVYEGTAIPVTVSIGVAGYPSIPAASPPELIAAADEALYEAKRSGRNRVVIRG